MSSLFKVKNPVSDYAQGRNLFELNGDPWVLASNSVGMSLFSRMAHSIILIAKETIRNLTALILSNLLAAHRSAYS